jgi:hypothetical protein
MMKRVVEMWRIHEVLFLNKEKAQEVEDGKEIARNVYVGVDVSVLEDEEINIDGESMDFFGDWVFTEKHEAERQVNEFNK